MQIFKRTIQQQSLLKCAKQLYSGIPQNMISKKNLFMKREYLFCEVKPKTQSFVEQNKNGSIGNSIMSLDSQDLLKQFKSSVENIENHKAKIQVCLQYSNIFKLRMENQKSLEIVERAFSFCQSQDNSILYFFGQKVLLNYELGRKTEMNKALLLLKAKYTEIRDRLTPINLIKYVKYLSKCLTKAKSYDFSKQIMDDAIRVLADNQQSLSLPNSELFEIYSLQSGINFVLGRFEESAKYGLLAYEQVESNPYNIHNPQYTLIEIYISYKELNRQEECQQILVELEKYSSVLEEIKIEDLTKKSFDPFSYQHIKVNNERKEEQDTSDNYTNDKNNNFLNYFGNDENFKRFLKQKLIKEGLEYYQNELNKLDLSLEIKKSVSINQKIAILLHQSDETDKKDQAIMITLQQHQTLQKARKFELQKDNLTLTNLQMLLKFYFEKLDYKSSIEWGLKWYTYCTVYDLFEDFNDQIMENYLQLATSLYHDQQYQRVLDLIDNISNYSQKSNPQNNSFINSINLLKTESKLKMK